MGPIYPLRARRRPRRVKGSRLVSLHVPLWTPPPKIVFLMRLSAGCLYVSCWLYVVLGGPKLFRACSDSSPGITLDAPDNRFYRSLFSDRFVYVFFMVLASILEDLFDDFPMFFASLFRDLFFMFFWSFPNRFLNRANHEIIKQPLVFIGLFALGTFRTLPIFQRISIQKTSKFRMDFSWNSWLFRHRFSHRFVHRFLMENGSQNGAKMHGNRSVEICFPFL